MSNSSLLARPCTTPIPNMVPWSPNRRTWKCGCACAPVRCSCGCSWRRPSRCRTRNSHVRDTRPIAISIAATASSKIARNCARNASRKTERMRDTRGRADEANDRHIGAILNLLGEHVEGRSAVLAAVDEYIEVIDAAANRKMDTCVSIKPTQCGIIIDQEFFWSNVKKILDRVRSLDAFLWMDMEGSRFTDRTLDVYRRALAAYDRVGVAVQTNLRRAGEDGENLLEVGGIGRP